MKKAIKSFLTAIFCAIIALTAVACGVSSDPAKAQENLEKKNYTVTDVTAEMSVTVGIAGGLAAAGKVEKALYAYNSDGEYVILIYFKESATAKELKEKIKELAEKYSSDEEKVSDVKSGRSGKVLYFGTKTAISIA